MPINPQTKCFGKQAFVYDEETDCFYCPAGKPLPREGVEKARRSGVIIQLVGYRGCQCGGCPLAERCRKNPKAKQGRKVTRDGYEPFRRRHNERMKQEAAQERYKRRFHYGETQFAVLKAAQDLRRFLLRGHDGAPARRTRTTGVRERLILCRSSAAIDNSSNHRRRNEPTCVGTA